MSGQGVLGALELEGWGSVTITDVWPGGSNAAHNNKREETDIGKQCCAQQQTVFAAAYVGQILTSGHCWHNAHRPNHEVPNSVGGNARGGNLNWLAARTFANVNAQDGCKSHMQYVHFWGISDASATLKLKSSSHTMHLVPMLLAPPMLCAICSSC